MTPPRTAAFRRWSRGARVIPEGQPLPERGPFVVTAYHGSRADIAAFWTEGPEAPDEDDDEPRLEALDPNIYWGAHFALEPHVADLFAGHGGGPSWLKHRQGGGSVYRVFLRLDNPVYMTEREMLGLSMSQKLRHPWDDVLWGYIEDEAQDQADPDAFLDMQAHGYDHAPVVRHAMNDLLLEHLGDDPESKHEVYEMLGSAAKRVLVEQGYDSVIYENKVEGGTSVIVFSPTQIKSATGNRGTFDPDDPDIRHNGRLRTGAMPIPNEEVERLAGLVLEHCTVPVADDGWIDRVYTPPEWSRFELGNSHVETPKGEHRFARTALDILPSHSEGVWGMRGALSVGKDGKQWQYWLTVSVPASPPDGYDFDQFQIRLHSLIHHELTHLADPTIGSIATSKSSRKGSAEYFNRPTEVTARVAQVVRELRRESVKWAAAQSLEQFMDFSPTWQRTWSFYTPENRRRFLRAGFAVWQNARNFPADPTTRFNR